MRVRKENTSTEGVNRRIDNKKVSITLCCSLYLAIYGLIVLAIVECFAMLFASDPFCFASISMILMKNLSSFMTCQRICNKSNTTDVTCRARTAYLSGAFEYTPLNAYFKQKLLCFSFSIFTFVINHHFFTI
jgi:hypothetical protein